MISVLWTTAFVDLPASSFDPTVAFWRAVTGSEVSPRRGGHGEFATLLPDEGDAFLRVQRVLDGPGGIHLDLHVADPRGAADQAVSLGATEVGDHGYVVLRSPGGFTFCLVPGARGQRPPPVQWPDGTRSLVDQVCLDVPSSAYAEECGFWAALTGWEPRASSVSSDFSSLARPEGMPLRFLLQRLGETTGAARAHLDLAAEDRAAEVRRHASLGASVLAEHARWTVLRDPAGAAYCVTDRDPATGMLP